VRSHKIEYHRPARAGERVTIRTWVATMKKVSSLRRFRILRHPDELLATAETNWAFIDYTTNRPVRIPVEIARAFEVIPDNPR
jgi:acyl-CoA thioester hydrolase